MPKTTSQPSARISPTSILTLFPPHHTRCDKAHGRLEIRQIRTSTALNHYLDFPHVRQAFCIERSTEEISTGKTRHEVVYGITSLDPQKAEPARLLELARGHWAIENRLHWVRDVTYDEDRCRVRKGNGPQVMASLRNLAISLLRMAGAIFIAPALRLCARMGQNVLRFLGLTF
ncbi:MAG: ISAs1 family transposase [Candidatus Zixiibacteriota bacterium]